MCQVLCQTMDIEQLNVRRLPIPATVNWLILGHFPTQNLAQNIYKTSI